MKTVSLNTFKIPANYILVKPDPDFEFVRIKPDSEFSAITDEVEIQIAYTSKTHARHYGISGTVVVLPNQLIYNKKKRENKISMEFDVDMELQLNDKVWFDYLCQINAVTDKLIVDTEEHGLCFLCKYEDIYCFDRNGEIELVNGWVWIRRIERDAESAGLELKFSDKNKFIPGQAIIVKAGKPVKDYLDGINEEPIDFNGGEQVIYDPRFGHEMEYSMHRSLTESEVMSIRRKHIYAIV